MNCFENWAARTMDSNIKYVANVHTKIKPIIYFLAKPFILWRTRMLARVLAHYKRLPPIQWKDIEKHGKNVVYGSNPEFTTEKIVYGIWVVDYLYKTRRIVFGIPAETAHVGESF